MIDLTIERCQNCDKKQLKSSIDKLAIERCRDCLKTIFQKEKNTDMNAICKVEFNQPFYWFYSMPNLLVFQHLVTLYLGGFVVRVVSEIEC